MPPGKRKALDESTAEGALLDTTKKSKLGVTAKVGGAAVSRDPAPDRSRQGACQGLKKNTQQLMTLFALTNSWMVRVIQDILNIQDVL